jgi:hypothetical protein
MRFIVMASPLKYCVFNNLGSCYSDILMYLTSLTIHYHQHRLKYIVTRVASDMESFLLITMLHCSSLNFNLQKVMTEPGRSKEQGV